MKQYENVSLRLSKELFEEIKGAGIFLAAKGYKANVNLIAIKGIELGMAKLRKAHNGGKRFKPVGRPGRSESLKEL